MKYRGRKNIRNEGFEEDSCRLREWIPAEEGEPGYDLFDQRPGAGQPVEIPREDGSILVLDSD